MSDALLAADILAYLRAEAPGHARAIPRRRLLAHLAANGHVPMNDSGDRKMRKAYESMPDVGSCLKGIFLILTAEDRRIAGKQLHAPAMASLVREKRIRDSAPAGQLGLWEERT